MFKSVVLISSLTLVACGSGSSTNPAEILGIDDEIASMETDDAGVSATEEAGEDIDTAVATDILNPNTLDTSAIPGLDTADLTGQDGEAVVITGTAQMLTINNDEITDLTIGGINHTVNIESNIGALSINGSNILVRFAAGVSVDNCTVAGSDNTAERGENVSLNCIVEGAGNIGFE